MSDYLEISRKLSAACLQKRVDGYAEIYADDIIVWHNTDQLCQNKAENLAALAAGFETIDTAEYDSIVLTPTPNGFVQEHIIVGTFKNGRPMPPTPACLVITLKDGRIARLNEYFDLGKMTLASEQFLRESQRTE